MMKKVNVFLLIIVALLYGGCSSYHDLSTKYQKKIQVNNYKEALETLDKNKFLNKERNKLLFYLEKGKLAHMNKQYELSNEYLNKADDFIELIKKSLSNKFIGVITNPEKELYVGEDFEKVAIHYYKALNYIFLKKYDDALVEAKRINLELLKINDSYPEGKKNRYVSDAFALNLQGLIYEFTGNINDAFIAYRNAIELFAKHDGTYFGVSIPNQLKQDVINVAHVLGFYGEEQRFSSLFNKQFDDQYIGRNSLVVFWENGLVPYKSQTYYTFTSLPGVNSDFMVFTNEELNLSFNVPRNKTTTENKFSNFKILNVSFPKYQSRDSYFTNGVISVGGVDKVFELVQSYEEIAIKTLKDRRAREIGKMALRIATKKIAEGLVSKQNENLGAILGLINSLTEKSDTRNWQTLPNKIYYSRVFLNNNEDVEVKFTDLNGNSKKEKLICDCNKKLNFINYITPQINSTY